MVVTQADVWTVSVVRSFGVVVEMSTPASFIASTAAGLT
jgi:hypothetical protein